MLWFIALGSAIGGASRYVLGLFIQHRAGVSFPYSTLVINISGSLLLGFLLRWALMAPNIAPEMRALLTTGFCGGYTTFSTFSYETAALLQDGRYGRAALYVTLSVVLSLLATFAGFQIARGVLILREQL